MSSISTVGSAKALAEIQASNFIPQWKELLQECLLKPTEDKQKKLSREIERLQVLVKSTDDLEVQLSVWEKVHQIGLWIGQSPWVEESSPRIEELHLKLFVKKVIQYDIELFNQLPKEFQSSSLSGLLALCQWRHELPHQLEEAYNQLVAKAVELIPLNGPRVSLTHWIDLIFASVKEFNRQQHEERQLLPLQTRSTVAETIMKEALKEKEPLSLKTLVELVVTLSNEKIDLLQHVLKPLHPILTRMMHREQLFLKLRESETQEMGAQLLEALGDAFGEESKQALDAQNSHWPELLKLGLMFYHASRKYQDLSHLIPKIKNLEADLQVALSAEQARPTAWKKDKAHQSKLEMHRNQIQEKLKSITATSLTTDEDYVARAEKLNGLQLNITQRYKDFVKELLQESISIMGKPPCSYAMVGFGSLEKQSCTLYSDLEFGFLLAPGENNPLHRTYFRHLTHLLHAKVIALGETPIPKSLFGESLDHLTGMGFCFDLGGKTSLGRWHDQPDALFGTLKYELIEEPAQFIRYVEDEYFKIDPLLPIEVARCTHITGDNEITDCYRKLLKERFEQLDSHGKTFYETRALAILESDLKKYDPYGELRESERLLNVKKAIFRLPDRLIDGLAFLFGITAETTFEKIHQLQEKKIIQPTAVISLKMLDGIAKELRLKTYHFYGMQQESLAVTAPLFADFQTAFYPEQTEALHRFYACAIPLHEGLQVFCRKYRTDFATAQQILSRRSFKQSQSVTSPLVAMRLGNFEQAYDAQLTTYKESHDDGFLPLLSSIALQNGKYAEALQWLEKELKIEEKSHRGSDKNITILHNLALAHRTLGHGFKAKEYSEQALNILEQSPQPNPMKMASELAFLGATYLFLGNRVEGLKLCERAYKLVNRIDYETRATILINFGMLQTNPDLAISYFEDALKLRIASYGREHVHTAGVLGNLGRCYLKIGNFEKAKQYCQRA